MHLATIAKLNVALHALLPMPDGSLAYITKRFDRKNKKKIGIEDLCQLSLKPTEDKYKSSYEKVGKIIYRYTTTPGEETLKFFELLLFSFIVGNADMHLKNFSLNTQDTSNITLTPYYDLLSTRLLMSTKDDPEDLALSLNGKKQNLRKKDFIEFGKTLNIPDKALQNALNSMTTYFSPWQQKIHQSFLNDELKENFCKLIKMRLLILN